MQHFTVVKSNGCVIPAPPLDSVPGLVAINRSYEGHVEVALLDDSPALTVRRERYRFVMDEEE